jgi:hypothetical protein
VLCLVESGAGVYWDLVVDGTCFSPVLFPSFSAQFERMALGSIRGAFDFSIFWRICLNASIIVTNRSINNVFYQLVLV